MPTYSYACTACDHKFDAVQAFTDDALTDCPECAGRLRKLFNAVGVVFKGSGFYRNDSRESQKSSSASSSSSSASEKSGSEKSSPEKSGSEKSSPEKSASGSTKDSSSSGSSSPAPAAASTS